MPDPSRKGFRCPTCKPAEPLFGLLLVYRVSVPSPHRVVRYRACPECGYRIVTTETQTRVGPKKVSARLRKRFASTNTHRTA